MPQPGPAVDRDRLGGDQWLLGKLVPLFEVLAQGAGDQSGEHVVDRRPDGPLHRLHLLERHVDKGYRPSPRDRGVERGARGGEGQDDARSLTGATGGDPPHRASDPTDGLGDQLDDVPGGDQAVEECPPHALEGIGGVQRGRALGRRGGRRVRGQVEELAQQVGPGDPVDGGVVHLDQQGDVVVRQAVDQQHLPQRSVPAQLGAGELTGQDGQLAVVARRVQVDAAQVAPDVEFGVVGPVGPAQVEGHADQASAHGADGRQALLEQAHDGVVGVSRPHGGGVQHEEAADVHVHRRRLAGQEHRVQAAQLLHGSDTSLRAPPGTRSQLPPRGPRASTWSAVGTGPPAGSRPARPPRRCRPTPGRCGRGPVPAPSGDRGRWATRTGGRLPA